MYKPTCKNCGRQYSDGPSGLYICNDCWRQKQLLQRQTDALEKLAKSTEPPDHDLDPATLGSMLALAGGPTLGFWTWFLIGTPLTLGHLVYTVAICVLAFLTWRLRPLWALVGFVGVALLLLWPLGITHMIAYSVGLWRPDSQPPPAVSPSPQPSQQKSDAAVSRVRIGMTSDEVRAVLGNPLSIPDTPGEPGYGCTWQYQDVQVHFTDGRVDRVK